jgi:hypothetical protein
MNFLHYDLQLSPAQSVEITLDKGANVRLLDDANYGMYQRGQPHRYYGGHTTTSPVRLKPPHGGRWHVVIDLGGFPGTVSASVRTIGV